MINDGEKYYYFAVKSKLELYSSGWLRSKKEAITNGDNCFQNALNDALDYQRIKKDLQKISKLKPYINQYNWLRNNITGTTSNHHGDFYCLNCFHSYRTLNKLKKHERVCNNHDYCHVDMPEEGKNILKYSPGDKSLKLPFIIYKDIECMLKKEQSCQNNPKNSYTQRKAKHKPSGYSLSLICSFDETKNRRKFYRRKDCIK